MAYAIWLNNPCGSRIPDYLRFAPEGTDQKNRAVMSFETIAEAQSNLHAIGLRDSTRADVPNSGYVVWLTPEAARNSHYASSETAYGRTVNYGFAVKVF